MGVDWQPTSPGLQVSLLCSLWGHLMAFSFWIMPNYPTPLLDRNSVAKLLLPYFFSPTNSFQFCLFLSTRWHQWLSYPFPNSLIGPKAWGYLLPSVASHHPPPIMILLWDPTPYHRGCQYHIPLKHGQGLKPIIQQLLKKGTVKLTHLPYNRSILPVPKPNGSYHLV